MNAIAFDSTTIHDIKCILAKGLPHKSGHLSEALAACLGERTHAALGTRLTAHGTIVARPDPAAALARLPDLEGEIDECRALVVIAQALVYGVEFARHPNGTTAPIELEDEWLNGIAMGCRLLYAARLRNASISWRTAAHLARARTHADARWTGMSLEDGVLVFDPIDLFRHDPSDSEAVIGDDIAALLRDIDPTGDIERPRSLKSLPASIAFDEAMAVAEALPETSFSELEGVRLATWLGSRLADHEATKVHRLVAFARGRLPRLAIAALQGYVAERFGTMALAGPIPQDTVAASSTLSEAEVASLVSNVNTKIFVPIDRASPTEVAGGTNVHDEGIFYMGQDATTGQPNWLSEEDVRRHVEILATTGHGHHEMREGLDREEGDIHASDISGSRHGDFIVVHDGHVIRGESFYARPDDPIADAHGDGTLRPAELEAPSIIASTNTKFYMRIDDMADSIDLQVVDRRPD